MIIEHYQQPRVPIGQLGCDLGKQWKDKVAGIASIAQPTIYEEGSFFFCPSHTRSLRVEHPGEGKARKVSGVEIHGFDDWRLLARIPNLVIGGVRYEVLGDTLHFTILHESLAIGYDREALRCSCEQCQEIERFRSPPQVVSQRSIRDILRDARNGSPPPLPKRHYVPAIATRVVETLADRITVLLS